MDKPIQVGDLVQVVMPARCCDAYLGHVFTVSQVILGGALSWYCDVCKNGGPSGGAYLYSTGDGYRVSNHRLKRIPPLSELETERTEDEVAA